MEALRSIDPKHLLTLPVVEWGKGILERFGLSGNGVLSRALIEERQLFEEVRGKRILRRALVGVEGHKVWALTDRKMGRFYGQARWGRQIVGGRKTPPHGRYEIWSQVVLQPNADSRTFIFFAADVTFLDEAEWRNRRFFEEAVIEAVRKPIRLTTYVMDFRAGNNWSNPHWRGTEITHLLQNYPL